MHKQILAGQDERLADAGCFKAVLFCSVAISQIVLSSFLNRFGNFFCLRGLGNSQNEPNKGGQRTQRNYGRIFGRQRLDRGIKRSVYLYQFSDYINPSLPWKDFSLIEYPDNKLQHTLSRSPYGSCDELLQATPYLSYKKKSLNHIMGYICIHY